MVLFLYVNIDQSPIFERIPKSFTPNITKEVCFFILGIFTVAAPIRPFGEQFRYIHTTIAVRTSGSALVSS